MIELQTDTHLRPRQSTQWSFAGLLRAALPAILFFLAPLPGNVPVAVAQDPDVIRHYNFAAAEGSPIRAWLEDQLFDLQKDFKRQNRIALALSDEGLHIKVNQPAFGLVTHEEDVPDARRLRLRWGVGDYPDGASYQRGVDDEAIMVYVFFGHETFDSGSMLIPDSPYFIGFYLCEAGADELEKPTRGNYFNKSGRYVCVAQPPEGELVVSEIDLAAEFKASFALDSVPPVSGLSIEVDTTHAHNDGNAAATIASLELLR